MLKTVLVSAALILVSQVANAQQARNCQTGQAIIADNFDAPTTMTVRSGKTCKRSLNERRFKLENLQFVELPKNGTLKKVGPSSYTYTANKGFAGADSFLVRYIGYRVDGQGNKTFNTYQGLKWTVDVVP